MDAYYYQTELELYNTAAAVSIAFNAPQKVDKLMPGADEPIDLEEVHPMLRPVRNRG